MSSADIGMIDQINFIQLEILKRLLFEKSLRHRDLRPKARIENNLLDYHIKQLIRFGFIEKTGNQYFLTTQGKECASRIDTRRVTVIKQALISVQVCPYRKTGKQYEFLIYTRSKHPFFGCKGFGRGKVFFGETSKEAAKRVLKEETNLDGNPMLISNRHLVYLEPGTSRTLDDRIVFMCAVENPKGDLIPNKEGTYEWVKEENLQDYITKPFISFDNFYADVKSIKKSIKMKNDLEVKIKCDNY